MSPKHVIDYRAPGPRAAFLAGVLAGALRGLLRELDQDDRPVWRDARSALTRWEDFCRER